LDSRSSAFSNCFFRKSIWLFSSTTVLSMYSGVF
jgi:hypothetical protein